MSTDLPVITDMTPRLMTTLYGNQNRVMQSFCRAPWDGTYFMAQVDDEASNNMRISRLSSSGKALDYAVLQGAGHGSSITAEYENGQVYIWLFWTVDPATGAKASPVRWAYQGTRNGATVRLADAEALTVPAGTNAGHFAIDQAADRIATYSRSGNTETLKLWTFSEFKTGTATALATATVTKPANASFQGFTTSDTKAYISRGGSAVTDIAPTLYEVDWSTGAVTSKDVSGLVLDSSGTAPGDHNEAEGVCLWRDQAGNPTLLFGIVTGPAQQRQARVYGMTQPVQGTATKTVQVDLEPIVGDASGVVAAFSYDRLVRYTTGGFTPATFAGQISLATTDRIDLRVSDHPDLTDDSYGFQIIVRLSWDDPTCPARRQTATYRAQLSAADPAVVALSSKLTEY